MENGFGGRLKLLRKKSGLTQSQLALMLGKSTSAVRMWELGTNEPDIKTLVKLSSIFDSSLDYLLCRDIVKGSPGAVRTNVEVINISEYSCALNFDTHIFRRVPTEYTDDGNAYIFIRNDQENMSPEFPVGAYVLIRRQDSCLNGQTVFMRVGEEFLLRKLYYFSGGILLNSANNPPVFVDSQDDFEIIGIAVEYTYTF